MTNCGVLTAEQSGSEIPGWVDGIAAVVSEADSYSQDGEADEEWDDLLADLIVKYSLIIHTNTLCCGTLTMTNDNAITK